MCPVFFVVGRSRKYIGTLTFSGSFLSSDYQECIVVVSFFGWILVSEGICVLRVKGVGYNVSHNISPHLGEIIDEEEKQFIHQ